MTDQTSTPAQPDDTDQTPATITMSWKDEGTESGVTLKWDGMTPQKLAHALGEMVASAMVQWATTCLDNGKDPDAVLTLLAQMHNGMVTRQDDAMEQYLPQSIVELLNDSRED